jgi:sigma-B regulation protein RsbU (phosphoserine phosphatase)
VPERILLVDDTPTNLQVLLQTLDGQGHELLVAMSGEDALKLARSALPSLILLDIMMPGIDGFETCRRLKADPATSGIAVIFMSALSETKDKVQGLELGAVDYITKPFQAPEVIARVNTHLELRRLHRRLGEAYEVLAVAHRRMEQDLHAAAAVQQALLPRQAPSVAGYAFAWTYRPCDQLAGDSLNVFPLPDDHVGLYVLDISGHGVAASLLAVSVTQTMVPRGGDASLVADPVNGLINEPADVAARLNRRYPMSDQANRYFTLVYGVLDARTGAMRHVCAGHPGPAVVRADGTVEDAGAANFPIGMVPDAEYDGSSIQLGRGDRLYLFSDGLLEEANAAGVMFGRDRIDGQLRATRELPLQESIDALIAHVSAWSGRGQLADDATVLAVERADR